MRLSDWLTLEHELRLGRRLQSRAVREEAKENERRPEWIPDRLQVSPELTHDAEGRKTSPKRPQKRKAAEKKKRKKQEEPSREPKGLEKRLVKGLEKRLVDAFGVPAERAAWRPGPTCSPPRSRGFRSRADRGS